MSYIIQNLTFGVKDDSGNITDTIVLTGHYNMVPTISDPNILQLTPLTVITGTVTTDDCVFNVTYKGNTSITFDVRTQKLHLPRRTIQRGFSTEPNEDTDMSTYELSSRHFKTMTYDHELIGVSVIQETL